jgi:hypothetical protein
MRRGVVDLVEQTCLSQTPGKKDKRGMNGRDIFFFLKKYKWYTDGK